MRKRLLFCVMAIVHILIGYGQTSSESVGHFGGTFNVSSTAGATYSIPIEISQSVDGLQPTLSLIYNSQSGNGIAGWGCNVSGLSAITRAPKDIYHDGSAKGLTYLADEAYLFDGKRMILSSGTPGQEGAVYYLESDPLTKIVVHGTYNTSVADTWFEVLAANGVKYYYGNTAAGRLSYTAGVSPRIYAWYLDYAEDQFGNYMTYSYDKSDYFMYPNSIVYGNNKNRTANLQNTVVFGYESRKDITPFIIEGVKGSVSKRLSSITSKIGDNTHRVYEMEYNDTLDSTFTKFSRLVSITKKNGAGESLKPIVLDWDYLPAFRQEISNPDLSLISEPNVEYQSRYFISSDLNGDGLSDIVQVSPVKIWKSPNSWSFDTKAYIYYASKELDQNGNRKFALHSYDTGASLGANVQFRDWQSTMQGVNSFDFNGDGINDLAIPRLEIVDELGIKGVIFQFASGVLNGKNLSFSLKADKEMPLYAISDFNNDGKANIIFIEKSKTDKYRAGVFGLANDEKLFWQFFDLSLSGKPEKMFVSDFNGNGMQDVMLLYEGGYTIFWNQGNGLTESSLSDSKKTEGTNFGAGYWTMIRSGDFNGDGLQDFLINNTMDSKWYFAMNNGNGTFDTSVACSLKIYDQNYTTKDDNKFDCQVYDFDNDGKSDVVITKAMYYSNSDESLNKVHTYWMRSTGSELVQVSAASSNREDDALSSHYVLGDFTGDGRVQLMNYGYNCYDSQGASKDQAPIWRMYFSDMNMYSGKIMFFRDNYDNFAHVSYASLANDSLYTKGTGSKYPFIDYTVPLHGVAKVVQYSTTTKSFASVDYRYYGLKLHLQGRGFLGFEKIIATDNRKRTTTQLFNPENFGVLTSMDNPTTSTSYNYNIHVADNKITTITLKDKTETDKLNNVSVTTIYDDYDAYGNPGKETVDYGDSISTVTTSQYNNLTGTPYILGRLKSQAITNTRGENSITSKMLMNYNAVGQPTSTKSYYDDNLVSTDSMRYNSLYQLIENKTKSYDSPDWMTTSYTYDEYARAKTKTNSLGLTETYGYDVNRQLETVKNHKNLVTTYGYDNWGRQNKITYPDGVETLITLAWDETLNDSHTVKAENDKPFPDEVSPDPYPKGKQNSIYMTIPTKQDWAWGFGSWDFDKNIARTDKNLITKTYKTVDIDEYEWTAENLMLKYIDYNQYIKYAWMGHKQADVDNYALYYLNNKTVPVNEFEKIFGSWATSYDIVSSYRNKFTVYDKENGTQIQGWKLPSKAALEQLYGLAPRTSGRVYEDIKDFLFASACDNPYDWGYNMFNRKNISGLTLTPLGMTQNIEGGDRYGFGQVVGLQTDQLLKPQIFSDMLLSGVQPGIFEGTGLYQFTQARYSREKTAQELGYKLYIDQVNDRVLMLPYNEQSSLPELPKGMERGIALRYANREYMYILKPWSAIQAEAAEIRAGLRLSSEPVSLPSQPCGIQPDPFVKGQESTAYMTVPTAQDWAWGFGSWDYDKNVKPAKNQITKTYKTRRIGEYEWTTENLVLKNINYSAYIPYAWINITQGEVNSYLENTNTTLTDFEKVFGNWASELQTVFAYRTFYKFYDKENGTLQTGWDLPTANDISYLAGLAPATSAKPWDNLKDFLFASPAENTLGLPWSMMNRKNTSGLTLTPLGMKPNIEGGKPYGFGQVTALKSKTSGYVHIFTDMSLSGSKIGLLLDNYNYHLTQVRYCRKLSDAELGYKMYIDETYDRVLMLPYDQVSALPELTMGIERGIALRYANKANLKVMRKWSQIKAEAADIKSKI